MFKGWATTGELPSFPEWFRPSLGSDLQGWLSCSSLYMWQRIEKLNIAPVWGLFLILLLGSHSVNLQPLFVQIAQDNSSALCWLHELLGP